MSLQDIKARAEKANAGPWWVSHYGPPSDVFSGKGSGDDRHVAEILWNKDAEFIAHARTDIPKLVAALEAVLDAVASPQDAGDVVCMAYAVEQAITEALA